MIYQNRADAILHEIIAIIGPEWDEFDTDAIADEILEWHDEKTPKGEIILPQSGYRVKDDIDFWETVESHAL